MDYISELIEDNKLRYVVNKDTITFTAKDYYNYIFGNSVLIDDLSCTELSSIATAIIVVLKDSIKLHKRVNIVFIKDNIINKYNIKTSTYSSANLTLDDGSIAKPIYVNTVIKDKDFLRFLYVRYIKSEFPDVRFDTNGDFYVFHAGHSAKPIYSINFNYHGSECGSYGFFCGFTPGLVLNHRNCGCGYISCYKVNVDKLLELNSNILIQGYIDEFDIVLSHGRAFCSRYGGQIVFRNSNALSCLDYIGCYYRSDYRNLILSGNFKDEVNEYLNKVEFNKG